MKKRFLVLFSVFLIVSFYATSVSAFGIAFVSKSLPSSTSVRSDATFRASIKYDSSVGGIPLPVDGTFQVEIPRLYELPSSTNGSWTSSSWKYTARTGALTKKAVWQAKKTFLVFGEVQKDATFNAKAATRGTSESYIGTGKAPSNAHYYRDVTVN